MTTKTTLADGTKKESTAKAATKTTLADGTKKESTAKAATKTTLANRTKKDPTAKAAIEQRDSRIPTHPAFRVDNVDIVPVFNGARVEYEVRRGNRTLRVITTYSGAFLSDDEAAALSAELRALPEDIASDVFMAATGTPAYAVRIGGKCTLKPKRALTVEGFGKSLMARFEHGERLRKQLLGARTKVQAAIDAAEKAEKERELAQSLGVDLATLRAAIKASTKS